MSKEVEKLLGKRVAELRRERGISQALLSELINVAPETISRLERGVNIPSIATLEDIAESLKVSLKDFFDFKVPLKKQSPSERELARVVALLSNKKAEEITLAYTLLEDLFKGLKKISK